MDKSIIFEKVKKIVAKNLKLELSQVTVNTNFTEFVETREDYYKRNPPSWSSISSTGYVDCDKINIIMEFEDEFDIEIPDEDWEKNISTVQQAVDYIYKKLVV
ncbi:acyl carrier protein [Microcoleus vaginatus DQ-U2]|uniref:acyl carrier protein n=1 Tax=Microcoleus vaginatus TaxID=119532 RepID=UPI001682D719|nr:acyl carrier protein [Microcoleus sp. FACHB-DQ6]